MSQNVMYELYNQSVNMCVHLMYKAVNVTGNEALKNIFCYSSTRFSELNC